jgi:hypothetical protein
LERENTRTKEAIFEAKGEVERLKAEFLKHELQEREESSASITESLMLRKSSCISHRTSEMRWISSIWTQIH